MEKTTPSRASDFWAEGIGGILIGPLLLSAGTLSHKKSEQVPMDCDSMEILSNAPKPKGQLPKKQSQVDTILVLIPILTIVPLLVQCQHVYGHQNGTTQFKNLPLLNQLKSSWIYFI